MNEITLENFRCFRDRQTARLAPLTLLVGDNSTGKTSFLALIRALWDAAYASGTPDFKEEPYDLGSFEEIAHHRGSRGSRADAFQAGFRVEPTADSGTADTFNFRFEKSGTAPIPVWRRISRAGVWTDETYKPGKSYALQVGTTRGSWERKISYDHSAEWLAELRLPSPAPFVFLLPDRADSPPDEQFKPLSGSPRFSKDDYQSLQALFFPLLFGSSSKPFATAPVRSRPRRTYDPSRTFQDPEGQNVPMYLANTYFQQRTVWEALKRRLEAFGKTSGLFDEISIKPLGKRDSEPFQIQLRKFSGGLKGPQRNLIDMGYGVSQVLPLITEMYRPDGPSRFLMQQPEAHLHPSAQAALGSLFCDVASDSRQLIVETHSDHILNRVRMDVRDGVGNLKPEDVSVLFFERGALDVQIHSIRIDSEGNTRGAPDTYRQFFLNETQRSLRL